MTLTLKGCPRCGGALAPDVYGDQSCLQCGRTVYAPVEPYTPRRRAFLSQTGVARDAGPTTLRCAPARLPLLARPQVATLATPDRDLLARIRAAADESQSA